MNARDIAGQGIANPIASILSFAMCLKYSFNMDKASDLISTAVNKVLENGFKTKDLLGDVRKISFGEGVERVFPIFSPSIDSVELIRSGQVRRAKLYYLRDLTGKKARIVERMRSKQPDLASLFISENDEVLEEEYLTEEASSEESNDENSEANVAETEQSDLEETTQEEKTEDKAEELKD